MSGHCMGQVRPVDVHRLLAEHMVDQQMLDLTAVKRAEFNEYALRFDLAVATPEIPEGGQYCGSRTRMKL